MTTTDDRQIAFCKLSQIYLRKLVSKSARKQIGFTAIDCCNDLFLLKKFICKQIDFVEFVFSINNDKLMIDGLGLYLYNRMESSDSVICQLMTALATDEILHTYEFAKCDGAISALRLFINVTYDILIKTTDKNSLNRMPVPSMIAAIHKYGSVLS